VNYTGKPKTGKEAVRRQSTPCYWCNGRHQQPRQQHCPAYSTETYVLKATRPYSHGYKSTSTANSLAKIGGAGYCRKKTAIEDALHDKKASTLQREFSPGEKVFVKPNPKSKHKPWIYGEVVGNPAPRACLVSTRWDRFVETTVRSGKPR